MFDDSKTTFFPKLTGENEFKSFVDHNIPITLPQLIVS